MTDFSWLFVPITISALAWLWLSYQGRIHEKIAWYDGQLAAWEVLCDSCKDDAQKLKLEVQQLNKERNELLKHVLPEAYASGVRLERGTTLKMFCNQWVAVPSPEIENACPEWLGSQIPLACSECKAAGLDTVCEAAHLDAAENEQTTKREEQTKCTTKT